MTLPVGQSKDNAVASLEKRCQTRDTMVIQKNAYWKYE